MHLYKLTFILVIIAIASILSKQEGTVTFMLNYYFVWCNGNVKFQLFFIIDLQLTFDFYQLLH